MVRFSSSILCLSLAYVICIANALRCMDENNNPVDWYIVYKIPRIVDNPNVLIKNGVAYAYMTSDDYSDWELSKQSINSTKSTIGNTLSKLYKSPKKYMHILYNDDPPTRRGRASKGHNKGIVAAQKNGGFWLIHSVPNFADLASGKYYYPETAALFGQSLLCISLNANNLNTVGIQLQYNEPDIYLANIPKYLESAMPALTKAANNATVKNAPWYRITNLSSNAGLKFTSFAKSRHYGQELYDILVAPTLKVDLLVESWRRGTGLLSSNCSLKYQVNNIQSVNIAAAGVKFTTTNDHSKWAVSVVHEKPWLCIGDINRADHQKQRGGGTVCFRKESVVQVFRNSIGDIEECKAFWSKFWGGVKGSYGKFQSMISPQ